MPSTSSSSAPATPASRCQASCHARRPGAPGHRRDATGLGGGWQDRWDEFTLVTPNWTSSFPGWAYDGADPDGFMSRDEIAARVARYAEVVGAPVALGDRGAAPDPARAGAVPRHDQPRRADRPPGRRGDRELPHAHVSRRSRRASPTASRSSTRTTTGTRRRCPPGRCSSSVRADRAAARRGAARGRPPVYVSVGSAGRVPRRYRGRDIFSWLVDIIAPRRGARRDAADRRAAPRRPSPVQPRCRR